MAARAIITPVALLVRRIPLVALAGLLTAHAAAQPAFKGGVNLVTIPAVVTAKDGSRIGDLGPADFRLWEDGVPQDIAVVNRDPRPLSVCILLDSSPSMAGREAQATGAINTMLERLRDDDEVALLMFASKVKVALPWTRARDTRTFSWYGWRLSLGTALLDAMREALTLVDRATNPLPVIVIVSDGGEMSSGMRLASLVSTRRQSETIVYALRTERPPSKTATPLTRAFAVDFLPDLVGDSGGRVYRAIDGPSAETAALALLDELHSQYTLGFTPKKTWDGKYRRIAIEATNPALAVRHRAGYLAHP
jgi:Ca-activated chloride channel family protein